MFSRKTTEANDTKIYVLCLKNKYIVLFYILTANPIDGAINL